MKVVTGEQMRALDRRAIQEMGIPSAVLMENAGLQVALSVLEGFPDELARGVAIVCGKGNNGGDGLVAARHLAARGVEVAVLLLGRREELQGDPAIMLEMARGQGIPVLEIPDPSAAGPLPIRLRNSGVVVDSLFGTGLTRSVAGFAGAVINAVNSSGRPVVAVDLPSGLTADHGRIIGPAVRADVTVTMGLPKVSLVTYPAAGLVGRLEVAGIGFPGRLLHGAEVQTQVIMARDVFPLEEPLPPEAHKGTLGHLLIVAGSPGKTGAAIMTARAAQRIGTGLVTVAAPRSINDILETSLVEPMTLPLPGTPSGAHSYRSRNEIMEFARRCSAVAVGPGLGMDPETDGLVRFLVENLDRPMVLDADGLNALGGHLDCLRKRPQGDPPGVPNGWDLVATPHPGEMARLMGKTVPEIQFDRVLATLDFAMNRSVWTVLKGARSVVATPAGEVSICPRGNPGMATGGTGDILTGIIGGLLAQRLETRDAAVSGTYFHALCGDLAAGGSGQRSMNALDLLDAFPRALEQLALARGRPRSPRVII